MSVWARAEMVKAQAGVLGTDGDEEAAAKLNGAVAARGSDVDEAHWVERHLRPLEPGRRDGAVAVAGSTRPAGATAGKAIAPA